MKGKNSWNHAIQKAMLHSMNRRIIECLYNEDLTFAGLLNKVGHDVNHGKFGYHLRTLREFIKLEPTTKKYSLTDRGELLAEAIQDFRVLSSMGKESTRYIEELSVRDHSVLLYDDDNFKHRIVFPYLKAGLSSGKAALYFASEKTMDSETRELRKNGIDIDCLPREAFTMMSACEWYLRKGKAKTKTIIANLQTLIGEKKKTGFSGMQIASEMAVFINNGRSEELLRLEESLGRKLDFDVCALCQYDKNTLEEEYFLRIFKFHGHIISENFVGKTMV